VTGVQEGLVVRVVSQNLERAYPEWLERLTQVCVGLRPDVVLLQHLDTASIEAVRRTWRDALGMKLAAAAVDEGTSVAVAYATSVFDQHGPAEAGGGVAGEGFGYCALRLQARNLRVASVLVAVSCVLSRYSAQLAAQQAQRLGQLAHSSGGAGWIGGGINHVPVGDAEPDWAGIPAYRRMAVCRLRTGSDEPWEGDDRVTALLAAGGFVDAAARTAEIAPAARPGLRAPTDRTPRGFRGDQVHVTSALAPTLGGCRLIEQEISGHLGLTVDLDLALTDINGLHAYV
jgi:hypothetical protein